MPGAALPKVPTGGSAKQEVLNSWLKVLWPRPRTGLQVATILGPTLEPVISSPFVVVNVGVNGAPVAKVTSPLSSQSSSIRLAALGPSEVPTLGRSYIKFIDNTCGRSRSEERRGGE